MRHLPWTLYRYLAKELLAVTLVSLGALCLLFMIVSGIKSVNEGFDLTVVMPWIFESLGYSLFYSVPASLLFATTIVYGRFSADREYTATCAAGIAPVQIFVPLAMISTTLAVVALMTVGDVMPRAHYLRRNIARYLARQLTDLGVGHKRELPIEGGRVYCEYHDGPLLSGVLIEKDLTFDSSEFDGAILGNGGSDGAPATETIPIRMAAKSARIVVDTERDVLRIFLDEIQTIFPNRETEMFIKQRHLTEGWDLMSSTGTVVEFQINEKQRKIPDDFPTSQLRDKQREFRKQIEVLGEKRKSAATDDERRAIDKDIAAYDWTTRDIGGHIWLRYAIALSCVTFPFAGFSISLALLERHRLVPFFIGTMLVVVVFYPLLFVGQIAATAGALPPSIAMSLANGALIATGCVMTGRMYLR